ncbi:MAG: signal peptidase I [Candidatus Shapirobacteria bacterium]|jgi:signal peptidase I
MKKIYRNQIGGLGGFLLEFIQSIVLALSVFVLLYLFVVQPNEVKGSSMFPNFKDKEFLLTDKLSYQMGDPKRGDVVVFKAPASEPCAAEECEYIKRVIGMPGDTVMVKGGEVYLNGKLLDQSFLPTKVYSSPGEYAQEGVTVTIPEGQYLCFGDNRPNSRDGREFGPIERKLIVGKAFFKYWPIGSIGLIPKISF